MKQQQHSKKKKKRRPSAASRHSTHPPPLSAADGQVEEEGKAQNISALMAAFDSVSFAEATCTFKEANGDLDKAAAEILDNLMDDPLTSSVSSGVSGFSDSVSGSSSSSAGSSSGSSEGFLEADLVNNRKGTNKQKKVLAATGTVSTVLGKEYVKKASPRRDRVAKVKKFEKEEAEQFLCSMLGDDCELSMAVVRDVLCQCGYNVEKALDILLELSASSQNQRSSSRILDNSISYKEDNRFSVEHGDNSTDRDSECTSHLSESELHDSIWDYDYRNYSQVFTSFKAPSRTTTRSDGSDLPQMVLESLFNIPKSSEHEPDSMNWKNVIKKMRALGPCVDVDPSSDVKPHQDIYAKGDEYYQFRDSARQHWDSMRSYFHKAATAYSNGQREYAAYLSDKGKGQTKLAREADKKASQDIFEARNKGIENVITIDLHGQHVKPAMRLLKVHLVFGTYARSIQTLRVITGCGSHGLGKSKLKQSVIKLLENEGIRWKEENQGTVLIKLDGCREYSFLDSDGDSS